jgi:hypothetical protein
MNLGFDTLSQNTNYDEKHDEDNDSDNLYKRLTVVLLSITNKKARIA